jgi:hypothetical protein
MSTLWKDLLEKVMNDSVCDDEFDDAIVALLNASKAERDMGEEVEGVRGRSFPLTSDGLGVRKVRREDYSRGPKTKKSKEDPSINLKWMSWIRDERIRDPATKEALQGDPFLRMSPCSAITLLLPAAGCECAQTSRKN